MTRQERIDAETLAGYLAHTDALIGDDLAQQITALHWGLLRDDALVGDIAAAGRASAALVSQAREPQGEPSDSRVKAFTDAEWEHRFMVFHGGWSCKCGWDIPGPKLNTDEAEKRHRGHQVRAALRAAGGVR